MITKDALSASSNALLSYAMKRAVENQETVAVYKRGETFIATGIYSDKPPHAIHVGSFVWTDQGITWVAANAANEST